MFWFKKKKESFDYMPEDQRPYMNMAFPKGEKQLYDEGAALFNEFPELFTLQGATNIVIWAKIRGLINKNLTFDEMCEAINRYEKGRLTADQAKTIFSTIVHNHTVSLMKTD